MKGLYDEKAVMNFNHIEGYGALMEKKLSLHVCSFSSPKGKHDITLLIKGTYNLSMFLLHQTGAAGSGAGISLHFA